MMMTMMLMTMMIMMTIAMMMLVVAILILLKPKKRKEKKRANPIAGQFKLHFPFLKIPTKIIILNLSEYIETRIGT